MDAGLVTSVNVDTNQSDKLLRLLDTAVIKLEGGTDEDLQVLDEKPNIDTKPEIVPTPALNATSADVTNSKADETEIISKSDDDGEVNDNDENGDTETPIVDAPQPKLNADETIEGEKVNKKRKRTTSGSSSSSSSSGKFRNIFDYNIYQ